MPLGNHYVKCLCDNSLKSLLHKQLLNMLVQFNCTIMYLKIN